MQSKKEEETVKGGKKEIDEEDSDLEIEDEIALWMRRNKERKEALNDKYFYRGVYSKSNSYDVKFDRVKVQKLGKYDKMLKKF